MKLIVNNLNDTEQLGRIFAASVSKCGAFVCLFGEIGSGKTTFTKLVANYLGVKENVTSPSFVILNEYHSGVIPLYHFDLYRLEAEGIKTIANELDEYSQGKVLTFVEWPQYANIELPSERIEIEITYIDEEKREFEFRSFSDKYTNLIKGIENEYSHF